MGIIANLKDWVREAQTDGWLGEVAGLNASLRAAAQKLVGLDRLRDRQPSGQLAAGTAGAEVGRERQREPDPAGERYR